MDILSSRAYYSSINKMGCNFKFMIGYMQKYCYVLYFHFI